MLSFTHKNKVGKFPSPESKATRLGEEFCAGFQKKKCPKNKGVVFSGHTNSIIAINMISCFSQ